MKMGNLVFFFRRYSFIEINHWLVRLETGSFNEINENWLDWNVDDVIENLGKSIRKRNSTFHLREILVAKRISFLHYTCCWSSSVRTVFFSLFCHYPLIFWWNMTWECFESMLDNNIQCSTSESNIGPLSRFVFRFFFFWFGKKFEFLDEKRAVQMWNSIYAGLQIIS